MPSRHILKIYVENGYYHVYNRGVEKRIIFENAQDYKVFLNYLKEYLTPRSNSTKKSKSFTLQGVSFRGIPRPPKNYHKKMELLAYCLMPNHFHLVIKQLDRHSLENFMRSLLTRYSMYFNKKYNRVGSLFQDTYKAVLINDESYLLHLSRYIHLNPLETMADITKAYSSYRDYLRQRRTNWVKPDLVLSFFERNTFPFLKKFNNYRNFVEKYPQESKTILGQITIEDNL